MRRPTFAVITIAVALSCAPAITSGAPRVDSATISDPWERFNRGAFAVNQAIDRNVFQPIARLFHLKPGPIGKALHNFLTNLSEPVVFFNDVLQVRPKRAAGTVARLVINTTVGVGGILDVAVRAGVPHHDNGFGLTLGRYGFEPGPYIYLPLFGPTTVRDLLGRGVDTVSDPLFWNSYPYKTDVSIGKAVFSGIDARIQAGPDLDALLSDAADPYATLRSTWLQNRQGEVDEARGVTAHLPDIEGGGSDARPAPPHPTSDGSAIPPPDAPASAAPAAPVDPAASASVDLPGEIVLSANHVDQAPAL